jgi:deltex-like protein
LSEESREDRIKNMQEKTKFKLFVPKDEGQTCVICCEDFDIKKKFKIEQNKGDMPVELPCEHSFCLDCLLPCFTQNFLKCPVCSKIYGTYMGTQPNGTMQVEWAGPGDTPLSGFNKKTGTIIIDFEFPDGIQKAEHANPGQRYSGTFRTAYLPDNDEGREMLYLFKVAFQRKLMFRIGTSVTTGEQNTVIFNGIHLKTSPDGGSSNFGYPDDGYFARVKDELAKFGITSADAAQGEGIADKFNVK